MLAALDQTTAAREEAALGQAPAYDARFADRVAGMQGSEIRELLKVLARPDVVSFAGGVPSPDVFPLDAVRQAYGAVLEEDASLRRGLQYSVSEGDPDLRRWIADHMTGRGVPCGPDNIMITNGAQQALEYAGTLFIDKNGPVAVTAPTYLGALQAFAKHQPHYQRLTITSNGSVAVDSNRDAAQATGRGLIYVVPDFANPTGETLGEQARLSLLDLAQQEETLILEDSPYEMLRFEGIAQPPIQALDVRRSGGIDRSRVVYCGSFSKVFTPGLRVGWVCASREIISQFVLLKQSGDLNSSAINQRVMLSLATDLYDAQAEKARTLYRERRDTMLNHLPAALPEGSRWSRPEGGMFIWVELPERYDTGALLATAVNDHGVAFVPGRAFFADGRSRNTMRLSYSLPTTAQIEDGMVRLGRAIQAVGPTIP